MRDTSEIEIDLAAIARNMGVIRRIVGPDCVICPVVKADAYGLGAVRVGRCLIHAGAGMLAVYTPDQVAELFGAALSGPVLVLMPVRDIQRADEVYRGLVVGRLHLSVHDLDHLDDLVRLSERNAVSIPLHLEVDTGMSRGGFDIADAPRALERIHEHPRLRLAGLYTHFAAAETDPDLTDRQDALLENLIEAHADHIPADCLVHAANTCAMLRKHGYHKSMVRIGQAWAGYGPEVVNPGPVVDGAMDLEPVLTWRSRIIQVKEVKKGTKVGYGGRWTAKRPSVIGLVPVGYADGYPFALSRRNRRGGPVRPPVMVAVLVARPDDPDGFVRISAPIVGNVSMDQLTIDLTDLAEDIRDVRGVVPIDTVVELITPDREAPNHLVRIAEIAGSPPYELLCRLNPRIRRHYRHAAAEIEAKPAVRGEPAQQGAAATPSGALSAGAARRP